MVETAGVEPASNMIPNVRHSQGWLVFGSNKHIDNKCLLLRKQTKPIVAALDNKVAATPDYAAKA